MGADPRLERWLASLVATPGLTAVAEPGEARRLHVEDALAARAYVERGPLVDVGSGGGSPGLPLAAALPELEVTLLESNGKKCAFLRRWAAEFERVSVVCERAEEHGRGAGRDAYGTVVARALAPPPVALEWCLPLVAPGGRAILYTGSPVRDLRAVSEQLGGGEPEVVPIPGSERRNLVLVPKLAPSPDGFPRRPGMARKRPLA